MTAVMTCDMRDAQSISECLRPASRMSLAPAVLKDTSWTRKPRGTPYTTDTAYS
jgi:hypothetical protein